MRSKKIGAKILVAIAYLLAVADAFGSQPTEQIRLFDVRQLFANSVVRDVRISADSHAIELERGELIEDDGPAAGFSYQANEEKIGGEVCARKELWIEGDISGTATLLIGSKSPFEISINGQSPNFSAQPGAGNYWLARSFDSKFLRVGKNEIVLRGAGTLWIARDDEFAAGSATRTRHANRSARSTDGGKTWDYERLGSRGDLDGEYYVRLFLDRVRTAGTLLLPVIDVGNLSEQTIAPALTAVPQVLVTTVAEQPANSRVTIFARTGTTPVAPAVAWDDLEIQAAKKNNAQRQSPLVPSVTGWSDWQILSADSAVIEKPAGRFLQLKIELASTDRRTTPRLKAVAVRVDSLASSREKPTVQIREQQNGNIVRSAIPFCYEPFEHVALKRLRTEKKLDELVAGAKDEFELIERLARWSAGLWKTGHLKDVYPAWNVHEILKPHADGTVTGGFCQQYNLAFLQACASFGLVGRAVSIGAGDHGLKIRSGHEAVEIWSNQFRKWIYVDGQTAWYFIDAATRVPLSMRELRDRQLKTFDKKESPPVELVRLSETSFDWSGLLTWPAFAELRMIPRNDFLSRSAPLPLNQGMRGWFWTGHYVWTDERYPASLLYGQRISAEQNWDWTLNETRWHLVATDVPRELLVHFETETPHWKAFEISLNGEAFAVAASPFRWHLQTGKNRLEVRTVNSLGRRGPTSFVTVECP